MLRRSLKCSGKRTWTGSIISTNESALKCNGHGLSVSCLKWPLVVALARESPHLVSNYESQCHPFKFRYQDGDAKAIRVHNEDSLTFFLIYNHVDPSPPPSWRMAFIIILEVVATNILNTCKVQLHCDTCRFGYPFLQALPNATQIISQAFQ
jgi:hypothetical protein